MTVIRPRSPEWYAVRRTSITSTDIPILLGLSPYKSEAELAREKLGEPVPDPTAEQERMFRLGRNLEAVIREEDEALHGIKLRRVNRLLTHPRIEWARTSLDFERTGERVIVEAKSAAGNRWDDGLPQDVEAQVQWQMGVGDYPKAHVSVLRYGIELRCFDLERDEDMFDGLVKIAEDFRRRLESGGPFTESIASAKARWPVDDGSEIQADSDLTAAVQTLISLRDRRKAIETDEERIEAAIKSRMADAAYLVGEGFRVSWKKSKDSEITDWKSLADGLLRQLPEEQREALLSIHTNPRQGARPFVVKSRENDR